MKVNRVLTGHNVHDLLLDLVFIKSRAIHIHDIVHDLLLDLIFTKSRCIHNHETVHDLLHDLVIFD